MSEIKQAQTLTDVDFETKVARAKGVSVVDFSADWCPPCNALSPILETLAGDFKGRASIFKLNVDEQPETPSRFGVRGLPTVIIFKDGKEVERLVGLLPKARFAEAVEKLIAKP